MNKYLLSILFLASLASAETLEMTCSNTDYHRDGVIELTEFSCESQLNCAVGVRAPHSLEGKDFNGFNAISNWQGGEKFDLAFDLRAEKEEKAMVTYLYGTQESLEKIQINVGYWSKGKGCSLTSSIKLDHNKEVLSPSAGTR